MQVLYLYHLGNKNDEFFSKLCNGDDEYISDPPSGEVSHISIF